MVFSRSFGPFAAAAVVSVWSTGFASALTCDDYENTKSSTKSLQSECVSSENSVQKFRLRLSKQLQRRPKNKAKIRSLRDAIANARAEQSSTCQAYSRSAQDLDALQYCELPVSPEEIADGTELTSNKLALAERVFNTTGQYWKAEAVRSWTKLYLSPSCWSDIISEDGAVLYDKVVAALEGYAVEEEWGNAEVLETTGGTRAFNRTVSEALIVENSADVRYRFWADGIECTSAHKALMRRYQEFIANFLASHKTSRFITGKLFVTVTVTPRASGPTVARDFAHADIFVVLPALETAGWEQSVTNRLLDLMEDR